MRDYRASYPILVLRSHAAYMAPQTALDAVDVSGRHLGRLLLEHCMRRLPARHYNALTLTVTEANSEAVQLYRSSGFEISHLFDALVLEKRRDGLSLLPRQS